MPATERSTFKYIVEEITEMSVYSVCILEFINLLFVHNMIITVATTSCRDHMRVIVIVVFFRMFLVNSFRTFLDYRKYCKNGEDASDQQKKAIATNSKAFVAFVLFFVLVVMVATDDKKCGEVAYDHHIFPLIIINMFICLVSFVFYCFQAYCDGNLFF